VVTNKRLDKMNVERLEYIADWLDNGAPHEQGGFYFDMNHWNDDYQ
jgi:hypothetical protein